MASPFDILVGAAGDVKELEYISALHQSDVEKVRSDGSIKAEDIRLFLCSRYGIVVTEEEVTNTILAGLSAGSNEADAEVLDLMEVAAALLIPSFLKAAKTLDDAAEDEPPATMVSVVQDPPDRHLKEGIVPVPRGMIGYVLKMILHDVTGDPAPKVLSKELLQRILISYGEYELAQDEILLQEMLFVATMPSPDSQETAPEDSDSGGAVSANTATNNTYLTAKCFANALTHDIGLYDISSENKKSTNLEDLYHQDAAGKNLVQLTTFSAIDVTAETYRSRTLTVSIWATFLVTYLAYYVDLTPTYTAGCQDVTFVYSIESPWVENSDAIACTVRVSVVDWLQLFAQFMVGGVIYISVGSIGNSVHCKQVWKPIVGGLAMSWGVLAPFLFLRSRDEENMFLSIMSLLLGFFCGFLHFSHAAAILLSQETMDNLQSNLPNVYKLFAGSLARETTVKKAAARKTAIMIRNALELKAKEKDTALNTHYGQGLSNYARFGKRYASMGGIGWAWGVLSNQSDVIQNEGIWLPARMVSANLAQFVVTIYVLLFGIFWTQDALLVFDEEHTKRQFSDLIQERTFLGDIDEELANGMVHNVSSFVGSFVATLKANGFADFRCSNATNAEEVLASYCTDTGGGFQCDPNAAVNYLCPLLDPSVSDQLNATATQALLIGAGFDAGELKDFTIDFMYDTIDNNMEDLYPAEKYMVAVPLIIGVIVAVLACVYITASYIPSVTATILKLRSGMIPSLRDKEFHRHRKAADKVTVLTGSIFWGTLVAGLVVGGVVAVAVFFLLWQATLFFAVFITALVVGILVVTVVKALLSLACRSALYKSFYRERPAVANLWVTALEWATFGLSIGFVIARMVKLIVAAGMAVGRIDIPFLAPGAGKIGHNSLDPIVDIHLKDILSHEAHRHPYIEQLGSIYLMKLRYGSQFGTRAGTCWRLVFVYALMPWLHKYRILALSEQAASTSKHLNDPEKYFPSTTFASLQTKQPSSSDSKEDQIYEMKKRAVVLKANGDKKGAKELLAKARALEFEGVSLEDLLDPLKLKQFALVKKKQGDQELAHQALKKAQRIEKAAESSSEDDEDTRMLELELENKRVEAENRQLKLALARAHAMSEIDC